MIITDLCVFRVIRGQGLELVELAPDVSVEEVSSKTDATFAMALA